MSIQLDSPIDKVAKQDGPTGASGIVDSYLGVYVVTMSSPLPAGLIFHISIGPAVSSVAGS